MNESQIFTHALELTTPAERAAFLDGACAGNPELRAAVQALLQAHANDPEFLERPAAALAQAVEDPPTQVAPSTQEMQGDALASTAAEPADLEGPGILLAGRYRLLEKIGEGGMGAVWMAQQQEPVKRLVAVKLIKTGWDSRGVLARFEAERQALAIMDHPNIAKVHDAGTSGDTPYFVMELVKGVPITKYCDEHRLTPRQRLELFVPVCQAIQHAHQKGIIHRDIKPTNVLVALYDPPSPPLSKGGHGGVPKVIDFGVAKATGQRLSEHSAHTGFGAVIGTIEYMSPEQASFNQLDVDTRSDIFALGVLLYELLTGSTPFSRKELEKAGVMEILRLIREQEPSKPSTKLSSAETLPSLAAKRGTEPKRLTRLMRGELDWIVMKALEKDRSRRYETASSLASDIQRYLADEPVQAGPPSTVYRLRKFARRHRVGIVSFTLIAAALVLGTVVSVWQAIRATQALQAEAAEHQRANENLDRAVDAVKKYLDRVTDEVRLQQADFHELRRDLLASAVPFYQEFVKQKRDDPALEFNRGRAFRALTLVRWAMGDHAAARREHEQARAVFSELSRNFPQEGKYRQYLASSISDLGHLLRETGQPREAQQAFEEALELRKQLAAEFPANAEYQTDLGLAYSNLGLALLDQRRQAEAILAFRETQQRLQPNAADPAMPADARRVLGSSHSNLGFLLYQQGSPQCVGELQEAIRVFKPLLAQFPNAPDYQRHLAVAYNHLGGYHRDNNHPEEAVAAYQEALSFYEPLTERFPTVPNYRSELGGTLSNLGIQYMNQGQFPKAQEVLERAIVHQRAALKVTPKQSTYRLFLSNHLAVLAEVLVARRLHAEAAAAAVDLASVRSHDSEDAYDAAGFLAQCVPIAQQDPKLTPEQQAEAAQRYVEQATNLLREAHRRGFKDLERLKADKALDALRSRPDFRQLLAEMEKVKGDK